MKKISFTADSVLTNHNILEVNALQRETHDCVRKYELVVFLWEMQVILWGVNEGEENKTEKKHRIGIKN